MSETLDPGASINEDQRALLQRRVAGFALAVGGFTLASLGVRLLVLSFWTLEVELTPPASRWIQAAAGASLLGIWLLTRRGRRSARFVRVVEAVGLLAAAVCIHAIAYLVASHLVAESGVRVLAGAPEHRLTATFAFLAPLIGASFSLTYVVVLRAAFVPTGARHTAALTAVLGAPITVVVYRAGVGAGAFGIDGDSPALLALGGAVQWAVTVAVCTAISRVIYGLREQVREARRLGQYTLEGLIGVGGMGRVYRASHAMLRRPTAIKLLGPDKASREALERFEREVQLTSQLTHPNTVTIYDYGRTEDGVLYYAMELLDGATLEEVVEIDGPQAPARVAHILEQVAGALGEAHAIGLIHRDVKPANIVLCRQGGELDVAKVVDFGLVKELDERHPASVSQEGTISGTPLYMAPEILTQTGAASPRSDIYALGAVGYYLLTGEHVFGGRTVIEVLGHHLHTAPIPPSQRVGDPVPEPLERLIMDCLAKDPDARPQDALTLRQRIEECELGRWSQRRAEKWWSVHGPTLSVKRRREQSRCRARAMHVDVISRSMQAQRRP